MIDEKAWALAQWEMHNARFCIQDVKETVRACAQRRLVPELLFRATHLTRAPAGIDVAVAEVDRIIKKFATRRLEGLNMSADEIHARINEERRGWSNLLD